MAYQFDLWFLIIWKIFLLVLEIDLHNFQLHNQYVPQTHVKGNNGRYASKAHLWKTRINLYDPSKLVFFHHAHFPFIWFFTATFISISLHFYFLSVQLNAVIQVVFLTRSDHWRRAPTEWAQQSPTPAAAVTKEVAPSLVNPTENGQHFLLVEVRYFLISCFFVSIKKCSQKLNNSKNSSNFLLDEWLDSLFILSTDT